MYNVILDRLCSTCGNTVSSSQVCTVCGNDPWDLMRKLKALLETRAEYRTQIIKEHNILMSNINNEINILTAEYQTWQESISRIKSNWEREHGQ